MLQRQHLINIISFQIPISFLLAELSPLLKTGLWNTLLMTLMQNLLLRQIPMNVDV